MFCIIFFLLWSCYLSISSSELFPNVLFIDENCTNWYFAKMYYICVENLCTLIYPVIISPPPPVKIQYLCECTIDHSKTCKVFNFLRITINYSVNCLVLLCTFIWMQDLTIDMWKQKHWYKTVIQIVHMFLISLRINH